MCSVMIVIHPFFSIIQTLITRLLLYSDMYVAYKHFIVNGLNPIYILKLTLCDKTLKNLMRYVRAEMNTQM